MTDLRVRELERRWQESGSVDDEAALLRERARVGDLEADRIELGAYLGHPAALVALGRSRDDRPIEDWLSDIPSHREFCQRFVLAAATACLPAWYRDHPAWPEEFAAREAALADSERLERAVFGPLQFERPVPRQDEPALVISAAEQLLVHPSAEQEEAVHDLLERATVHGLLAAQPALAAASLVCSLYQEQVDDELRFEVQEVAGNACRALALPDADLLLSGHNARERRGLRRLPVGAVPDCPRLWTHVREDVVQWIFGYSDPVRDRVERRERSVARGGRSDDPSR
ncbi:MAG: hypothetical protein R3F62_22785 [Planctomycetota bacterium]